MLELKNNIANLSIINEKSKFFLFFLLYGSDIH